MTSTDFGIKQITKGISSILGVPDIFITAADIVVGGLAAVLMGLIFGGLFTWLYADTKFRGVADQKEAQIIRKTKIIFWMAWAVLTGVIFFLTLAAIHFWRT